MQEDGEGGEGGGNGKGRITLIVIHHVPQMIPSAVMSFPHTHRVVREVDITVIAFGELVSTSSAF